MLVGQVMVERSDRIWSAGEGNGKPLQYSCLENSMNSMKRQNDRILKEKHTHTHTHKTKYEFMSQGSCDVEAV